MYKSQIHPRCAFCMFMFAFVYMRGHRVYILTSVPLGSKVKTSGSTLTDDTWQSISECIWSRVYESLYLKYTAVDSTVEDQTFLLQMFAIPQTQAQLTFLQEGHKMSLEMVSGLQASLCVDFNRAQVCVYVWCIGLCTLSHTLRSGAIAAFMGAKCMHFSLICSYCSSCRSLGSVYYSVYACIYCSIWELHTAVVKHTHARTHKHTHTLHSV